jgi:UDP-glucose 4-epimerase
MKILLTGGLGQVGSYAGERLSEDNEVTIIDNFSNSLNNIKFPSNIKIIKGDIRNHKIVTDLVGKADTIIHTAAQTSVNKSVEDPIYDADNNINGTLNLLEAARKSDIERFVYISSAAVYGKPEILPINEEHPTNPLSPYGLSKLTGERYAILYHSLYGLPVVCLRPFNIFSPRQNPNSPYSGVITRFIERVRSDQNPVIFGDGNQTRDFVFIEDVVAAIFNIMENKKAVGDVFNIGTGNPTRIKELAKMIIKVSNKKLEPEFAPASIGDISESYADITKAREVLGYRPKYLLEQGLKLCIGHVIKSEESL